MLRRTRTALPAYLVAAGLLASLAATGCETHKANGQPATPPAAGEAPEPDISRAAPTATDTETPPAETPPAPPAETPPAPPAETPPAPPAVDPATNKACVKVGEHLISLLRKQLETLPPEAQQQAESQIPAVRARIILECTRSWTDEARACVMKAKSAEQLGPCEALISAAPPPGQPGQPTPPPAEPEPKPVPPEPATPAPDPAAAIGGPSCDKVGANAAAVYKQTFGADDNDAARQGAQLAETCRTLRFSKTVKECFYAATRWEQVMECNRGASVELQKQR